VESKLAKRAYELLASRVKELFHGVSLMWEGRSWSALEGVQLLELAQWREFNGYVWRIYKAGLLVAGGKAVAVYALKYVREEESGDSGEDFFAVASEPLKVKVRERSRWREEVWRGAWREAELVEREEAREVEVPVSPELVGEALSLLNPLLGAIYGIKAVGVNV
jgi:hypothetical protein